MQAQRKQPRLAHSGPFGAAQAQFQRGLALHQAGRLDPAIAAYSATVRLNPAHADAMHNMGVALKAAERPAEAIVAWERVMRLRPDQADAVLTLGQALLSVGRTEEAAALLTAACRRHPGEACIFVLSSRALLALGRSGLAIGALFLAVELQPGDATIHAALAHALLDHGDVEQAMKHSLEAFRLTPDAEKASTLSCVLIALGHYNEALALADHALALRPDCFAALVNRSIALEGLCRFAEAMAAGQAAVSASPNSALARHNLAATHLALGQLTPEAWDLYEWRLLMRGDLAWFATTTRWDGEDITGRTILLHAEQGLGDTLQFVRYAPLVAVRAGRVILAVQPALVRLLRAVPGVDHVVAIGGVAALRCGLPAAEPAAPARHDTRHHPAGPALCRGVSALGCRRGGVSSRAAGRPGLGGQQGICRRSAAVGAGVGAGVPRWASGRAVLQPAAA